ncbi:MAG: accessory factor UbiK family protein, partial [Fluviibacter sp.]
KTRLTAELCKMLDPKMFEDFTQRVSGLIANSPAADIEKNVRSMMSSFFSKLDLVTREEFDTQANVLARTRQLVDQLTARLDELEKNAK